MISHGRSTWEGNVEETKGELLTSAGLFIPSAQGLSVKERAESASVKAREYMAYCIRLFGKAKE